MKLKVLIFDIETSPMLAYVWDRHQVNISLNQLKDDWHVIAWAAKWLGDPPSKVMYRDQRNAKNVADDKAILEPLWKLLDEADIVITQNGKNFDSPKLNARFLLNGMQPPSPYKHVDTYQIVSRVAKFTSNKLEYLTDKLCVKYKKLSHSKFPGMSLWQGCLSGNKDAWDEMKTYNIHDVLATEELYLKVRAWAPETTPQVFPVSDLSVSCPTCGVEGKMQRRGFIVARTRSYQRFQCQACAAWHKSYKRVA